MRNITQDLAERKPVCAKKTKVNREFESRAASESEEEEGNGHLLKEQNDELQNRVGENFAALKKCMQYITHQIWSQDNMIYKGFLEESRVRVLYRCTRFIQSITVHRGFSLLRNVLTRWVM